MPFDEEELDPHGECAARIHELEAERNVLKERYEKLLTAYSAQDDLCAIAEGERDALREALRKHGVHVGTCIGGDDCSCGLDAALAPRPPVKESNDAASQ